VPVKVENLEMEFFSISSNGEFKKNIAYVDVEKRTLSWHKYKLKMFTKEMAKVSKKKMKVLHGDSIGLVKKARLKSVSNDKFDSVLIRDRLDANLLQLKLSNEEDAETMKNAIAAIMPAEELVEENANETTNRESATRRLYQSEAVQSQ